MIDIRIISCISPKIEDAFRSFSIENELVGTFEKAMRFFNNAKHLTMLIIPNQLLAYFNADPRLRILKESIITNPQSNVIFAQIQLPINCEQVNFSNLFSSFQSSVASLTQIIWYLSQRKIPMVIDSEPYLLEKRYCDLCCLANACFPDVSLQTYKLPDIDEFNKLLVAVADKGIGHWNIRRDSVTPLDLKILAFLLCVFHNFPGNLISQIKDIEIHDKFCEDIKDDPCSNLVNITLSLARAALLPSASDPNNIRHELSIDWHKHTAFEIKNTKLYRVDVVSCSRSGITNSGIERILMTVDGKKKHFVAYTSTHDFVQKTIKTRLET